MSVFRFLVPLCFTLSVVGCASTKSDAPSARTAFAPVPTAAKPLSADQPVPMEPRAWVHGNSLFRHTGDLAGRTIDVSSLSDLKLGPKEVVLTFDDGPKPGKTDRILATLDQFGVKATFLMIGEMAAAHPETARRVAERGHSIGSHTWDHPNLAHLSYDQAMTEILRGEKAVRDNTGAEVGFFRFPYLAGTPKLRSALANRGTVVLDASIDSKDYFKSTPEQVAQRTVGQLGHHHGGIILMHDIHARTALMLPALLAELEREDYKVVHLRYHRSRMDMIAGAKIEDTPHG